MAGGFDTRFRIFKAKNVGDGSILDGGVCVPEDGSEHDRPAWDGTNILLRPPTTRPPDGTDGSDGSKRDAVGDLIWINVSGYTIPAGDGSADGTQFSAVCTLGNVQYIRTIDKPVVGASYLATDGTPYLKRGAGSLRCTARLDGTHGLFVNTYNTGGAAGRVGVVTDKDNGSYSVGVKIAVVSDGNATGIGEVFGARIVSD